MRAAGPQPRLGRVEPLRGDPAEVAGIPVIVDPASGGPNRQVSVSSGAGPSGAVSSHRTATGGWPARLSAYGSVRWASQATCRSRSVSRNSMPSGPVISRPCAQCSASRVVASVAGFTGPVTHCSGWSGSAARTAASAACRARCHRANTIRGRGPLRPHHFGHPLIHRILGHRAQPRAQLLVAGRGLDPFLGLGQVQHHVGDRPALRPRG